MDELPGNLSALDDEVLLEERAARDEKLRPLFRRWPSLSKTEMRLHDTTGDDLGTVEQPASVARATCGSTSAS